MEIKTFGLTEEQRSIAEKMINGNMARFGNYTIDEVADREMVNVWIADAHSEGDAEYAEFLRTALAEDAELYMLTDHIGDFAQTIGDIAVYQ